MELYTKELLRDQLGAEKAWLEDRLRNLEKAKETVANLEDSVVRVKARIEALKTDLGER